MNKAVVIKYEEGWISPKVLLKSKGTQADQVKEIAQMADIPIVQDPSLLDSLWGVEEGCFVEEELFEILASVLSFVYTLQRKEAMGNDE
jgi:type III secretion system FlhB-like substrate exporter